MNRLWIAFIPWLLGAACLPVTGDRILGRDLAAVDPVFAGLPAKLQLGFAPVPGAQRSFTAEELRRIAQVNGLKAPITSGACFEFALHTPADAEFEEAMRRSLPSGATVRTLDMQRTPIPSGRIEFALQTLEPASSDKDGFQLWRGYVQYTETRRALIWARVLVSQMYTAIVARRDLSSGEPVNDATVQLENRRGPLRRKGVVESTTIPTGRVLQHDIKAGDEVAASDLIDPPAVRRGDSVRVEVQSGLAVIHFDAVAENTVRAGGIAELRSPLNGAIIRVRIGNGASAVIVLGKTPLL